MSQTQTPMSACYAIDTSRDNPHAILFRLKPAYLLIYARSLFSPPSGHSERMYYRRKGWAAAANMVRTRGTLFPRICRRGW